MRKNSMIPQLNLKVYVQSQLTSQLRKYPFGMIFPCTNSVLFFLIYTEFWREVTKKKRRKNIQLTNPYLADLKNKSP